MSAAIVKEMPQYRVDVLEAESKLPSGDLNTVLEARKEAFEQIAKKHNLPRNFNLLQETPSEIEAASAAYKEAADKAAQKLTEAEKSFQQAQKTHEDAKNALKAFEEKNGAPPSYQAEADKLMKERLAQHYNGLGEGSKARPLGAEIDTQMARNRELGAELNKLGNSDVGKIKKSYLPLTPKEKAKIREEISAHVQAKNDLSKDFDVFKRSQIEQERMVLQDRVVNTEREMRTAKTRAEVAFSKSHQATTSMKTFEAKKGAKMLEATRHMQAYAETGKAVGSSGKVVSLTRGEKILDMAARSSTAAAEFTGKMMNVVRGPMSAAATAIAESKVGMTAASFAASPAGRLAGKGLAAAGGVGAFAVMSVGEAGAATVEQVQEYQRKNQAEQLSEKMTERFGSHLDADGRAKMRETLSSEFVKDANYHQYVEAAMQRPELHGDVEASMNERLAAPGTVKLGDDELKQVMSGLDSRVESVQKREAEHSEKVAKDEWEVSQRPKDELANVSLDDVTKKMDSVRTLQPTTADDIERARKEAYGAPSESLRKAVASKI